MAWFVYFFLFVMFVFASVVIRAAVVDGPRDLREATRRLQARLPDPVPTSYPVTFRASAVLPNCRDNVKPILVELERGGLSILDKKTRATIAKIPLGAIVAVQYSDGRDEECFTAGLQIVTHRESFQFFMEGASSGSKMWQFAGFIRSTGKAAGRKIQLVDASADKVLTAADLAHPL